MADERVGAALAYNDAKILWTLHVNTTVSNLRDCVAHEHLHVEGDD